MNVLNRVRISMAILRGRTGGWLGPATVCNKLCHEDGSPSYHRASWELDIVSGEGNCDGTKRIEN